MIIKKNKILAYLLSFIFITSIIMNPVKIFADSTNGNQQDVNILEDASDTGLASDTDVIPDADASTENYSTYLEENNNAAEGEETIVAGTDKVIQLGNNAKYMEENGTAYYFLEKGNDSWVEYSVDVSEEGLYRITLEYAQTDTTTRDIKVQVSLNGRTPFKEAADIAVPRIYKNETEIRKDANGNEIAPKQVMVFDWQVHTLANTTGFYEGAYQFYLQKGTNKIRLAANGVDLKLKSITLSPPEAIPTYDEYLAANPGKDTTGQLIKVQAENAQYKTGAMLYPTYDRNNSGTEDSQGKLNSPSKIRINAGGGELWKNSGQWMSWNLEVPEDGYYNLGFKYRQNYLDGLFTSRKVLIDDKILFDGMQRVEFNYDDIWQTMTLADGSGKEYKIYLTAGTHEIKMEVTMGAFTDSLRRMNDCVFDLNNLYLQIVMITGATPDKFTDYFLEDRIPGLKDIITKNRDKLEQELNTIIAITGGKGSATGAIDRMRIQLDSFLGDTEKISYRLRAFKNNISALGTWLVDMQDQKLQLDYIYLKSPDVKTPKANVGFINRCVYSIERFLASFNDNNAKVGASGNSAGSKTVKVWLNTAVPGANANAISANATAAGRDQAQVLRDLIDEMFTPETGINVELELVQGSLIEATVAGRGPDVAIMTAEDQPVNFAIRGALQDLSKFDGWDKVKSRFYESSVLPFEYQGGTYAVPDTQVFNMLFYRTDVFKKLNIKVPNTWDDFYNILPIIQRNNLQITIQDIFATVLFQNGGTYYCEDGTSANLGNKAAIEAMKTYTDFYTDYGFPVKTDFYSRFRSGEVVMSIQPYNVYNQLVVAAPEINGLWDMVAIPGVAKEDGSIDRSSYSTVSGTIMLNSAKDKEAAWKFMEWWSRDEVKARYGIQLEGLLGPSSRFTPANIKTLELLPWSDKEYAGLSEALSQIKGIPQIPGSYYTVRALQNAFRSIVYDKKSPRQAMVFQNKLINYEIARKREEFGLTTAGGEE